MLNLVPRDNASDYGASAVERSLSHVKKKLGFKPNYSLKYHNNVVVLLFVRTTTNRYPAIVACDVCDVTPRMLDYWITTDVIQPSAVFECDPRDERTTRRKAFHLFDFDALVHIKIIKDLRDIGLSLQRIRYAIKALRNKHGNAWQSAWIVTDGKTILKRMSSPQGLESLTRGEKGQLVFSVIALGETKKRIEKALKKGAERYTPFQIERYKGTSKQWSARTISA